jgi:hypothetical protein
VRETDVARVRQSSVAPASIEDLDPVGTRSGRLLNAKKKFCANDVIPACEAYYRRVLSES